MKCITELKDWDFKIPELGFEKRVTLPYTWNVENERFGYCWLYTLRTSTSF